MPHIGVRIPSTNCRLCTSMRIIDEGLSNIFHKGKSKQLRRWLASQCSGHRRTLGISSHFGSTGKNCSSLGDIAFYGTKSRYPWYMPHDSSSYLPPQRTSYSCQTRTISQQTYSITGRIQNLYLYVDLWKMKQHEGFGGSSSALK